MVKKIGVEERCSQFFHSNLSEVKAC